VAALLVGLGIGAATTVRAGDPVTGISVVVLNATCPGPCSVPPKPWPRYEGDGLTVVVRSLPDRKLVAKFFPTDGTVAFAVPPGLYRVKAWIGDRKTETCWVGSSRKVLVVEGEVTKKRLKVVNVCVV
jgi:hypothetical protein